jgi:hypothetical protein
MAGGFWLSVFLLRFYGGNVGGQLNVFDMIF